jgi:hypothetical protein
MDWGMYFLFCIVVHYARPCKMPELRQGKLLYTVFVPQGFYDFIYDSVVSCIVELPSLNPNWWSGMTVDRPRSFLILFQ